MKNQFQVVSQAPTAPEPPAVTRMNSRDESALSNAPATELDSHQASPQTENSTSTKLAPATRASLSIVIPTYNRADTMAQVVRKTRDCAAGYTVEWIIIDDGSSDCTQAVLAELQKDIPNLTYRTVENGGPGRARNLGASLAKHDVILFMGDDILPANEDFLRIHSELHGEYRTRRFAVLGKVIWPSSNVLDVNFVMRHIQGHGGEQFGYADFRPYEFLDWRFFYTCNVSVKRDLVDDWLHDGFSPQFSAASFEDGEFAYRLAKTLGAFEVFYAPSSIGYHLHPYEVDSFIRRHELAGAMIHTLTSTHPELGPLLGMNDIYAALQTPARSPHSDMTADYLAAIEGIKAWARILEHEHRIGNEGWHDDLLFIVFDIALRQGYLTSAARNASNFEAAYACLLKGAKMKLSRILDSEIRSDPSFKARMLALN